MCQIKSTENEETIGLVRTEPTVRSEVKRMALYRSTNRLLGGTMLLRNVETMYPARCKNPEDNTLTKKAGK